MKQLNASKKLLIVLMKSFKLWYNKDRNVYVKNWNVSFEEFLKDFRDTAICHINDWYTVYVKGGYLYDVVDGSDVPVGNYWTKRS